MENRNIKWSCAPGLRNRVASRKDSEQGIVRGEINDLGSGFRVFVMAVRDPDHIQLELTAPYDK